LRAPLADQWSRTDAVIVVGDGARGTALAREAGAKAKSVFRARLEPDHAAASRLQGRRVSAFAGIGRPEKFFATLRDCGTTVVRTKSFPDHHPYTRDEIRALVTEAHANELGVVTTEKDLVRLSGLSDFEPLRASIQVLPVRLAFEDEPSMRELLREHVEKKRRGRQL
jgi:tetraacyldisaccharide 4'-kinase